PGSPDEMLIEWRGSGGYGRFRRNDRRPPENSSNYRDAKSQDRGSKHRFLRQISTYVILPQVTTMSAFLQGRDADVAGIKQAIGKRPRQPIRGRWPVFQKGECPCNAAAAIELAE